MTLGGLASGEFTLEPFAHGDALVSLDSPGYPVVVFQGSWGNVGHLVHKCVLAGTTRPHGLVDSGAHAYAVAFDAVE